MGPGVPEGSAREVHALGGHVFVGHVEVERHEVEVWSRCGEPAWGCAEGLGLVRRAHKQERPRRQIRGPRPHVVHLNGEGVFTLHQRSGGVEVDQIRVAAVVQHRFLVDGKRCVPRHKLPGVAAVATADFHPVEVGDVPVVVIHGKHRLLDRREVVERELMPQVNARRGGHHRGVVPVAVAKARWPLLPAVVVETGLVPILDGLKRRHQVPPHCAVLNDGFPVVGLGFCSG